MTLTKRGLLAATASVATGVGLRPARAQTTKLRFGVGPLLPSPTDTIKAYTPIFDHLAKQATESAEKFALTQGPARAVDEILRYGP